MSSSANSSSLIVVSNRLPFVLKRHEHDNSLFRKPSAGGLVTAVCPVMVQSGGLWVGWSGMHLTEEDKIPESDVGDKSPTAGLKSKQIMPINLEKEEYELYYNGCCNATFWPLFHSMPDRSVFNEKFWIAYKKVNEKFAEATLKALRQTLEDQPGKVPIVWIHDYHLMLAANTIRQVADEENLSCKLGFFLHIPFPPWDLVKIFPWDDMILQGILACDLVGFHTNDYCVNFLDCCERGLGSRVDKQSMLVEHARRSITIRAMPIAIPFSQFESVAEFSPINAFSSSSIKVILGVDRLDYTKGVTNRLLAFERFLEEHPEYMENVLLMQIAVPSRTDVQEYQDLKEHVDKLVGMINGRFSTSRWAPIRYIYGCLDQTEVARFYRDADVGLVTPLRDGMNLVAKEFVACQVNEPGVLILSSFAGAAETMQEALQVNPYEISNVAQVLYRALTMPKEEREVRMNALRTRERTNDVTFWMNSFMTNIGALMEENGEGGLPAKIQPVSVEDFNAYLAPYVGDKATLALLLDYDGTLAPIAKHPDLAIIPPETKRALERLSKHPDVFIAIISGRGAKNAKEMVGIEGITYAGNHGMEILHGDGSSFIHPVPMEYQEKLAKLLQRLNEEVCRDGAWVENKGILLTYHYREVPQQKRNGLVEKAKKIITDGGFKVGPAHCALEIKPSQVMWDKGTAAIYILRTNFGVDWSEKVRVLFAGDDVTDEDAINALEGMAITFKIGDCPLTKSNATKRLSSTDAIVTLLKWTEKHMAGRMYTANAAKSTLRVPVFARSRSVISM